MSNSLESGIKERRETRRSELASLLGAAALLILGATFNNLRSQTDCFVSLATTQAMIGAGGVTNEGFAVYSGNTCTWTATTSANNTWINFVTSSGTGNGGFVLTITPNTTSNARSGVVTVASSGGSAQLIITQLSATGPPPPVTITTASLRSAAIGQPYAGVTLQAAGGTPPYSFALSGGTLPPGLSLTSAGFLHGTPTSAGNFTFTISATDSGSPPLTAKASFTILVYVPSTLPPRVITTVVGTDWAFPAVPRPAVNSPLGAISGVSEDLAGNLLVADPNNNMVFLIAADGTLSVLAGNGIAGFSGDGGAAVNASLNQPMAAVVDLSGNIYIADSANSRVRRVAPDGTITTVAGSAVVSFASFSSYTGDNGPAVQATLDRPSSLALDRFGNLYIGDSGSDVVRKVDHLGTITTFAGVGGATRSGSQSDGARANQTLLEGVQDIAVDSSGDLYILEDAPSQLWMVTNNRFYFGSIIRKVTSDGLIRTVVGSGMYGSSPNGGAAKSLALGPNAAGMSVDNSGNMYFSDTFHQMVFKVTTDGIAHRIAGSGQMGDSGAGGVALNVPFNSPGRLAWDVQGNLYIADSGNNRVRRLGVDGMISLMAGNGGYQAAADGVQGTSTNLNAPGGLAFGPDGSLYISETNGNRIVRLAPSGVTTNVAGTGAAGYGGDNGPAEQALLSSPYGMTVDRAGNLYVADQGNVRIRKVTPNGTISTFAGNGVSDYTGDGGQSVNAALVYPTDVAADAGGDVYIAAQFIRKVTPGGVISTVIGSGIGFGGDGGPATKALINDPWGVATDQNGNIYVADLNNGRIRRVDSSGNISTFAGDGDFGAYGDGGPATVAGLGEVLGVRTDTNGNVYIVQIYGSAIRMVTPNGIIQTLAGTGGTGNTGDGGPATAAQIGTPRAVAIDQQGNVFIADAGNNRVREVLAAAPTVQVSSTSLSFSGQASGAPAPSQSISISSVPGLAFSTVVSTTSGGNWLTVSPQSGAAPRLIDVVADPSKITSAGIYHGTITIATPNGNPTSNTVNVTFTVSAAQVPTLAPLDPQNFSFAFAKSTPAQSQRLTISNAGGGTLNFTVAATVTTPAGAKWLKLSQASGQATPGSPAVLTVTADPTGLGPGTFTGTISVTAGGTTLSVPVTITVSALDQAILLSQRGLFFTAVAQGGVIPPQTFAVLNIGTGVVAWTAKAVPPAPINGIVSTVPWLSVSPTSGSTDASQSPPNITVTVDASKLGQGTYYGLVEVDAPTAANRSQVLTVVLQVLAAGTNAGAVLTPGSLLFSTSVGASSPSSQNVLAYNIAAHAKSFRSVVSADPGLSLVTLPTDATLDPLHPTAIVVQPFTNSLGPGVYSGLVTLQFDDGRVIRLTVKVIVAKAGASSAGIRSSDVRAEAAVGCTPTKLQPILTAPNDAFEGFTGFGIKLGAFVKDDCGVPLESGSVNVKFSNGDTGSDLRPLQGGLWEGTWHTQKPSPSVNLMVHASNPQGLSGDLQTNGSLASQTPPTFDAAGIISAFGGAQFASLAPGEVISIYGSALAETSLATSGFPLQPTLVDTQVTIQGTPLPLYYVGAQQVNAVVPYSLTSTSLNAPLQILVQRGTVLSQPVYVNVAAAEPTIYGGVNAVTDYPANYPARSSYIVSAATPAHAGDTILIYCLGLGTVNPPVADGGLPTGISNAAPVQMSIGNQPATVSYQVLSPQFPGLYQVAAIVPAGVQGSTVPITISSGGQTGPPIMIAIQ